MSTIFIWTINTFRVHYIQRTEITIGEPELDFVHIFLFNKTGFGLLLSIHQEHMELFKPEQNEISC